MPQTATSLSTLCALAATGCSNMQDNVLAMGFAGLSDHSQYFDEKGTPQRIIRFIDLLDDGSRVRLNNAVKGDLGISLDDYVPAQHRNKAIKLETFIELLEANVG